MHSKTSDSIEKGNMSNMNPETNGTGNKCDLFE